MRQIPHCEQFPSQADEEVSFVPGSSQLGRRKGFSDFHLMQVNNTDCFRRDICKKSCISPKNNRFDVYKEGLSTESSMIL